MEIVVIIVNYKSAPLVINCLNSIYNNAYNELSLTVVIVDNASNDGSVVVLNEAISNNDWSDFVKVISSNYNGGFSCGNNLAIEYIEQQNWDVDLYWLLNPDAEIISAKLTEVKKIFRSSSQIGICGTRVLNESGGVESSAKNFLRPLSEFFTGARLGLLDSAFPKYLVSISANNSFHECDWVSGASMFLRKELVKDVGRFDEEYFLYFEEQDFCRKAKNAGWKVFYSPAIDVMHREGAVTGIKDTEKPKPKYWFDSRRRYFTKFYGLFGLLLADCFWLLGRLAYKIRVFLCLVKVQKNIPPQFTEDMIVGDLRSLFSSHKKRNLNE